MQNSYSVFLLSNTTAVVGGEGSMLSARDQRGQLTAGDGKHRVVHWWTIFFGENLKDEREEEHGGSCSNAGMD